MDAWSPKKTKERFNRRNELKAKGRRKRRRWYCETPVGQKVTLDLFLEPMAEFMAGKLDIKPPPPPADLGELVNQLDPHIQALVILVPLLNLIARRWDLRDDPSWEMRQCKQMGAYLRDQVALKKLDLSPEKNDRALAKQIRRGRKPKWKFLKSDWTDAECAVAGGWMLECASTLDYFDVDDHGRPIIAPKWQEHADRIREELLWRDPVLMPHFKPPPDWTGWLKKYDDRLQATFARDWRVETKAAITAAFSRPDFEHARGVNALKRVPFRIDTRMLALVEEFAVKLMDDQGEQREADEDLVKNDIATARGLADQPFWLDYSCDKRGRVFAVQHLNYGREDHVRSLFKFARGLQLDRNDLDWLAIHCANCEGSQDKATWDKRIEWADDNRETIQKIAADPVGTFDLWRNADKPFAYVAACRELAGAWRDPTNFKTHLPIGFDGSANGIQHLALLCRDPDAARRVNLIETDRPQDLYGDVVAHVVAEVKTDAHRSAAWWRDRFNLLTPEQRRKLLKTPAMTYAYNVTDQGMVDQLNEVYAGFRFNEPIGDVRYLARKIREACDELLPGPASVMHHIRDLAKYCLSKGYHLEWVSPTGFPVANRYNKAKKTEVNLLCGAQRVRHKVADGHDPSKPRKTKALNSAAPNFVHSMDAAHLIRVVNAAVSEDIINVAVVHDSFSCMAPQARRFNQIIRRELILLYARQDHLGRLRKHNLHGGCFPEFDRYGDLDLSDSLAVRGGEYSFS